MMKRLFLVSVAVLFLHLVPTIGNAQATKSKPEKRPSPTPSNLTAVLENNLKKYPADKPLARRVRQQAYAKLLEGQRHLWRIKWSRSRVVKNRHELLARTALQKSVELNPKLAEGYTALAELALIGSSSNIDEGIMLSRIAVKLDSDNFGAHRFLARLYTIKSNIGRGRLNKSSADFAIAEWKAISRLDRRNAEAWAFLSLFYKATKQKSKRIETLKNWLSSATPLEPEFYANVMQGNGELSVQNAATKLGAALLEDGQSSEALKVLTRAVSDNPRNKDALDLLGQALEGADPKSLFPATTALRQAVFANPGNQALVQLLAETIAKGGEVDGAVKVLQDAVSKSVTSNKLSASKYQLAIGDIFADSNRTDEAIVAYKKALTIRGIKQDSKIPANDRDFAINVINKMVSVLRKANRRDEAERLLRDSRPLFGGLGVELEKQRIDLLVETGKLDDALIAVRAGRNANPEDIGFLRREASILTDQGRVNEGSAIIEALLTNKPKSVENRSLLYDDFSNYLFLSSLFVRARQEDRATKAIGRALEIAEGKENKQIAKLNLAFVQQSFGHYKLAERNLREILATTPGYPIALNNLGYLLLKQEENIDEARSYIAKAVKIEPRNPSYLDSLGWAYYKLGRLDEAEATLQKAFQINPTSATILEHLGDVYRKRGKLEEAKQVWAKALVFASNSHDSDRLKTKLTK